MFYVFLLYLLSLSYAYILVCICTTNSDASAVLDIKLTDRGSLAPRLDYIKRDAISSPAEGLSIYDAENDCLKFWNDTYWVSACDGSAQLGSTPDCSTPGFILPYLTAEQTEIVDVTNPIAGDAWLERDLVAYIAEGSTRSSASGTHWWTYGNLYKFGLNSDRHKSRLLYCTTGVCFDADGEITMLPVTAEDVAEPNFACIFIYNMASPFDWYQAHPDNSLLSSSGDFNTSCPADYCVPTETEMEAEHYSWDGILDNTSSSSTNNNREGEINSLLKLLVAGGCNYIFGQLVSVSHLGNYWFSTVTKVWSKRLYFWSNIAIIDITPHPAEVSVHCLKF